MEEQAQSLNTSEYKALLSEVVIGSLKPIRDKINELRGNQQYIDEVLLVGSRKAQEIAVQNLDEVKRLVGLS